MAIAAATATFSEPTRPTCGIKATALTAASSAGEQPWSSLPIARQTSPPSGASASGTADEASSTATTRKPASAAAFAAAGGLGSRKACRNRSVPSAVLPTEGRSSGGVLPQSQMHSAPNAAAVRTIDPTLKGWLTESSSRARRPSVRRRHSRFSRFTSVGRSCLGAPPPGGLAATGVTMWPFGRIQGRNHEETVTAPRGESCHRPALLFQPGVQRVGAEIAADHQGRPRARGAGGAGGEPGKPAEQQVVQGRLADPHRRIRPNTSELRRYFWVVRDNAANVTKAGLGRVARAQAEGPLVHVDRPDGDAGRARRQHAGDGPVAAAEVQDVTGRGRPGRRLEQQPGAWVQAARGEHPRIGVKLQVDIGQHDPDQARAVRRQRLGLEVVLGAHRLTGWADGAAAAIAGLMYRRVSQRSTTNVSTGIVPASSTSTVGPVGSRSLRARR